LAPHFDINLIVVGQDRFSAAERQAVQNALSRMTSIFAVRGPTVGTITRFQVSSADAGSLVTPRNPAECRMLGDKWAIPNTALDLFVVRQILDGSSGRSPVGGPCDKHVTLGMRAPVVAIDASDATNGAVFAHEVAHFLRLPHCEDNPSLCAAQNLMLKNVKAVNTRITDAQAAEMKQHCFVRP
jgi:hypothetical protein